MHFVVHGIAPMGVAAAASSVGFFLLNDPRCGGGGGTGKKGFLWRGETSKFLSSHPDLRVPFWGVFFKKRAERFFWL